MKYLIFVMFFHCNSNMKMTEKNVDLKKISIEWTGNIDKPIPKIIICTNCMDEKMILKKHQYRVSSKTLNDISLVFEKGNNTESAIKIDETTKKIYLPKLNELLSILIRNNENELLIEDIRIFNARIDF